MTEAPSRKQDQFIVRLPNGMRDKIRESADRNNRSMNAEIVSAIQFYFDLENLNDPQPTDSGEPRKEVTIQTLRSEEDIDQIVAKLTETYKTVLRQGLLDALEEPVEDHIEE
ncbi:Arc family DNA-binding protein [Pararhodobacter oceanensis]|uniref:Arc family DNA-binding protein n=1 Tax=Pararhodobacter oceanensis TaxID=2172121 RepID=UPI003A904986